MPLTNNLDVSLALAVWLLHDEYDLVQGVPNYISATSLLKPTRALVLGPRVDFSQVDMDVADFAARAMGKALHDSVEKAWRTGYMRSLKMLGYSEEVIQRVRIDPTDEEIQADPSIIPVYLERRFLREIRIHGKTYTVGGKFDFAGEGGLQDFKSTSAWSWKFGDKDDDWKLQMSIYRWIDAGQPVQRITSDIGRVNLIFTDWQRAIANRGNGYPPHRTAYKDLPLLSLEETEAWIRQKLSQYDLARDAPEERVPQCTDKDLWLSEPEYKYFARAENAVPGNRATKNFDNLREAREHMASKGGVGAILTVPGEPKRCSYCEAFPICSQKDRYFPA